MDHPCNYLNLRREAAQPANLAAVPTGMPMPCLIVDNNGTGVFYGVMGGRGFGFSASATAVAYPVLLSSPVAAGPAVIGSAGDAADVELWIVAKGAKAVYFVTNSVQRWSVGATGHLTAFADNTYDIGASGANRPRTIYAGTSVVTPLLIASQTQVPIASAEAATAVVTGPATTQAVVLASIAATDLVMLTPLSDPASAGGVNHWWATVNAGVGFTVNVAAAPLAPCTFAYTIIRRA